MVLPCSQFYGFLYMIEDGSSGSSHYIYIPTSKNENGSLCVPASSQVYIIEVAYITPAYISLARIPSQVYNYLSKKTRKCFYTQNHVPIPPYFDNRSCIISLKIRMYQNLVLKIILLKVLHDPCKV